MLTALNNLNKQHDVSIRTLTGLKSQNLKPAGKLLDRIEAAKSKKEKREIINEWILDEIKKINKDSELEDF